MMMNRFPGRGEVARQGHQFQVVFQVVGLDGVRDGRGQA